MVKIEPIPVIADVKTLTKIVEAFGISTEVVTESIRVFAEFIAFVVVAEKQVEKIINNNTAKIIDSINKIEELRKISPFKIVKV